ncbi:MULTISPECIES: HopJ type III effector protein [unclassified Moraxella]|uniref:HopJ type III effector protein n=1 Tax=unclassified Moraxella TaxID=2685852 RepID=UPI003AF76B77
MNNIDKLKLSSLLAHLDNKKIDFKGVLHVIDSAYHYTPTAFINGEVHNEAGENEGSCKVFGFALHHNLTQVDTLKLFAEHYEAVKNTPKGTDHANIRNFSFFGWQGFLMPKNCLTAK